MSEQRNSSTKGDLGSVSPQGRFVARRSVAPMSPGFVASNVEIETKRGYIPLHALTCGDMIFDHRGARVAIKSVALSQVQVSSSRFGPVALRISESVLILTRTTLVRVQADFFDDFFGSSSALIPAGSLLGTGLAEAAPSGEYSLIKITPDHPSLLTLGGCQIEAGFDGDDVFVANDAGRAADALKFDGMTVIPETVASEILDRAIETSGIWFA